MTSLIHWLQFHANLKHTQRSPSEQADPGQSTPLRWGRHVLSVVQPRSLKVHNYTFAMLLEGYYDALQLYYERSRGELQNGARASQCTWAHKWAVRGGTLRSELLTKRAPFFQVRISGFE